MRFKLDGLCKVVNFDIMNVASHIYDTVTVKDLAFCQKPTEVLNFIKKQHG